MLKIKISRDANHDDNNNKEMTTTKATMTVISKHNKIWNMATLVNSKVSANDFTIVKI